MSNFHPNLANLNRKGRLPGSVKPPKKIDLYERCLEAGYNPIDAIVEIADGDIKCLACRGKLVNLYPVTDADGNRVLDAEGNIVVAERLCQSCYGTGWEVLTPETLLKARIAIFDKLVPSLKQVEHSNTDGTMRPQWVVQMVQVAPQGAAGGKTPPQINAPHEE